ncbi:hypothetical protein [Bacillus sp. B1-b2]|uniref:hypothetical protein n=1 Tax=Bacillus sp. B1-b2 TaxID=2653201 RepID=UPI00126285F0|nr:hypothetical protein [Bacillus sp. B1-b2]KAB7668429.1 hypothetical protein F9279_13510 [Bacillus sp. B1-b2]
MVEFFKLVSDIVNIFHEVLQELARSLGFQATDKELHLWIIGLIGIISFFFVQLLFKRLAKWSITSISFIYTFTMILVLVFAIEIQQGITNSGNVEFADAVVGIYGFLLFFAAYLFIRLLFYGMKKLFNRHSKEITVDDSSSDNTDLPISRSKRYQSK